MTYQIRQAVVDDIARLSALKVEVATKTFMDLGCEQANVQKWIEHHNNAGWWMRLLGDPITSRVFVVETALGSLVATAAITRHADGEGYMGSLYSRIHGEGLGSMLMRQRLIAATELGVDQIHCNIMLANERAQRLVKHYGFVEDGSYLSDELNRIMVRYIRTPHIL